MFSHKFLDGVPALKYYPKVIEINPHFYINLLISQLDICKSMVKQKTDVTALLPQI